MKEKIAQRFQELHGDVSYPTSHVVDVAIEVLREEIERGVLTDEERMGVNMPCETCKEAISTAGGAMPDFDTVICLDCAAKCHNKAQLDKILKILE